jgi:N-acyl-L-homoserine lactone synthetase
MSRIIKENFETLLENLEEILNELKEIRTININIIILCWSSFTHKTQQEVPNRAVRSGSVEGIGCYV